MPRRPTKIAADRPFGQPAIAKAQAVLEPFQGRAHKFYLLLPRYREGREIFQPLDALNLFLMLIDDFGGCSFQDEEKAPIIGGWKMREADQSKTAIDLYRHYTIYTQPTPTARNYFRRLESHLRQHLWATQGVIEEQIMIERSEVEIIKGKA